MDLDGTSFQQLVWKEISKIPYGQIRSYKQIAINIGHPNSSRAVANACGSNPNPITIPCCFASIAALSPAPPLPITNTLEI